MAVPATFSIDATDAPLRRENVCHENDSENKLYNELYGDISTKVGKDLVGSKGPGLIPLPKAPPGKPSVQESAPPAQLPDGRWNTFNGQPPLARFNSKGQRILPGGSGGSRFIPPEEYKEFLHLGHGGIFDLDLNNVDMLPWRVRGVEQDAYFNYGFTERSWREYTVEIRRARIDAHLKNQIEIVSGANFDSELPDEVRQALTNSVLNSKTTQRVIPENELSQINSVTDIQNKEKILGLNHKPESEQCGKCDGMFGTKYSKYSTSETIGLSQIQDEARRLQEQYAKEMIFSDAASSNMQKFRQKMKVLKILASQV